MARLFTGDPSQLVPEVVEAVSQLPDDWSVLFEISPRQFNLDVVMMRPRPNGMPGAVVLTEIKRVARSLRGGVDGLWSRCRQDGVWETLTPRNEKQINPYRQSVNGANDLAAWLCQHRHRLCDPDKVWPASACKVWPTLLLLSSETLAHELPPRLSFGAWCSEIEPWLNYVRRWQPEQGPVITQSEIDRMRMVELHNLVPIDGQGRLLLPLAVPVPARTATATPPEAPIGAGTRLTSLTAPAPAARVGWADREVALDVTQLQRRLDQLDAVELRLEQVQRRLAAAELPWWRRLLGREHVTR